MSKLTAFLLLVILALTLLSIYQDSVIVRQFELINWLTRQLLAKSHIPIY